MSDTNYISSIVKILELPKQNFVKDSISMTSCRAQLPEFKVTKLVQLTFWGTLAHDITKYYGINDYILIEGYISLRNNSNQSSNLSKQRKIEITVLKAYPYFLNSNL